MLNWDTLAPSTNLVLHWLHYASLLFMIGAYTIKVRQILQKVSASEGTPARGSHKEGIRYSFLSIAAPWEMESYRTHALRYVEFVAFHVAMLAGIGVAFTLPWGHGFMTSSVVVVGMQALFAVGAVVGSSRLVRRIASPAMRAISTPDDYFCLLLLVAWMVSGVMMAPQTSEPWLAAYFWLATFFLFYVPFSKISHYVYWFFTRYYVGKHFGHRGVFPKKRVANA